MKLKSLVFALALLTVLCTHVAFAQALRPDDAYARKRQALELRANQLGIPVRTESGDGSVRELQGFTANGIPLYYFTRNDQASQTISTNLLYPGGSAGLSLTGSGVTAGEWDGGGVRLTHQDLTGRATQMDVPGGLSSHATHVAGTIIGAGTVGSARGMAYQANLNCYDWNNDLTEMSAAASGGLRVSNHSYGYISGWYFDGSNWYWYGDVTVSTTEDYRFGFYDLAAQQWDQVANSRPFYLICKAAGNDRGEGPIPGTGHYYWNASTSSWTWSIAARNFDGNTLGYNCIEGAGVSKNILTVGAVNGITGGYSGSGSVVMSSFSGWGATDDGRIKPDVVAKGVSTYSTESAADNAYGFKSGTSMATPSVTGSIAVLLQHRNNLAPGSPLRASTMRGLLIHTADEAGPATGPDYQFGWGLMNTTRAAQVISAQATSPTHIYENTLNNSGTISIPVVAAGSQPLKVTISWNDPAATPLAPSLNPTASMLVNDLDLRVNGPGPTTYFPYILDPTAPGNAATNGDNTRDNVEVVNIASPTTGATYFVTVTHKGALSGGSQIVSIIITGNADCSLTCPANITTNTDPNVCTAVVNYPAPGATGSCGVITCSPASGSAFPKGVTTVNCVAGSASCSFTVTVNDVQPPTITCPANLTKSTDPNVCTAVVTYAAPTVTDNCPGSQVPVCTPASGSVFSKGSTTVTCTGKDAVNNSATCTFTVTINDTQPPSITCPANITKSNDPNQCGAVVTWAAPVVSDNCPGVQAPTCSPASGSFFSKGTSTVTCTVKDAVNNTASCSFTVTVNDTQPPTITCPANMAVESDATCAGATVNYPAPVATDNCPGVTVTCSPASGSYFPAGNPITVTTVTCTAKDASNNTASCSFTISVEKRPNIKPAATLVAFGFGCKSTATVTKSVKIDNDGGHFSGGVLSWNATTAASEITLTTASGTEGQNLVIKVNPTGLAFGTYNRTITITGKNSVTNATACNSPYTLNIVISVEPEAVVTQTKAVSNAAFTAFTNSVGQTIAEVKSNLAAIPSFTVTMNPCVYPNGMTRLRYVKKYFTLSTGASPRNVDVRLYYNNTESALIMNPTLLTMYQQQVVAGAWTNLGGTSNPFLNNVLKPGITNLNGIFAMAAPWTPKAMSVQITATEFDRETQTAAITWQSPIITDENGFIVERLVSTPEYEEWKEVGAVSSSSNSAYRFTEPMSTGSIHRYRLVALDRDGELFESAPFVVDGSASVIAYALEQNYPNPFNPSTEIRFALAKPGFTTLHVYDVHMRVVKTLVADERTAGMHSVRLDATELPSGTYYYRLESGSFSQTRKMNLVK